MGYEYADIFFYSLVKGRLRSLIGKSLSLVVVCLV